MSHTLHIRHASFFGLVAALCYAINNTLGKYVIEELSPYYLIFFRFFLGFLLLIPFFRKSDHLLEMKKPHLMIARGCLSFLVFSLVLFSLKSIPIANALTLSLVYPLFLPLIVRYFFKRKIPHTIYFGIGLGFIGIFILLDPSLEGFILFPSLLAFLAGLLIAVIFILIRKIGKTQSSTKIMFDFYLIGILLSVIPMAMNWTMPSLRAWMIILGMAISGNIYQVSLNYALKKASSVVVAPMMFSSVVLGMLSDFVLWSHAPSIQMIIGTTLIFVGVVVTSIINFRHAEHLT